MKRSDLVSNIAAQNEQASQERVEEMLDVFFDTIAHHVLRGGRVELRNFGAFWTSSITRTKWHNPRTMEVVNKREDGVRIRFRASRKLMQNINLIIAPPPKR